MRRGLARRLVRWLTGRRRRRRGPSLSSRLLAGLLSGRGRRLRW